MRTIARNVPGAICGILIGLVASACAGKVTAPMVKWWFNDSIEEKMFIRKECDANDQNCIVVERLTYEQADGFYAISPVDWERRENYIKSLENNCK